MRLNNLTTGKYTNIKLQSLHITIRIHISYISAASQQFHYTVPPLSLVTEEH